MGLMRLTYFSTFKKDPEKHNPSCQFTSILDTARYNNSRQEITGALVFNSNWFVQILEGERDAVWPTFKKIEKDERHSGVTPIEMAVAPDRCFGNWWMTFIESNAENSVQFEPFLVEKVFDPSKMAPDQILALMINLTCQSPERELGIAGIGAAARVIRERPNSDRKTGVIL